MSPLQLKFDRAMLLTSIAINAISLSLFLLDLYSLRIAPSPYFPRTWVVLFFDIDIFNFWQYTLCRSVVVLPWFLLSAYSIIQKRIPLSIILALLSLVGTMSNTFVLLVTNYR